MLLVEQLQEAFGVRRASLSVAVGNIDVETGHQIAVSGTVERARWAMEAPRKHDSGSMTLWWAPSSGSRAPVEPV